MAIYFGVVGQWDLLGPKTLQGVAYVIVYPPEFDSKISLLKKPHMWVTEHNKSKLILIWKPYP